MRAYEDTRAMIPLVELLHTLCGDGEFVIFRQPFRWKKYDGDFHNCAILGNCYEMFQLTEVLETAGLEFRYSFEHAAIVFPSTKGGDA